jgi:NAD dependent epimerase/dehydratase
MKILITGADGFIGSHLCEDLCKKGYKVRAFSFYSALNNRGCLEYLDSKILKKLEIISGDIRDPFEIDKAVKNCNYVVNLAALIGIPYSYVAPKNYLDTNLIGTLNILEASKRHNIKRIILTSTSEVYGTAQQVPITEKHPLNAQSPYAASKIAGDQLGLSYFHSFGLPVTIIRPFNTFGPRQSGRAIIPSILLQILNGLKYIKLGNISPTRDFNYIEDTINAFVKAIFTKKNISGEIINIGSGHEISIKNLFFIIKKLVRKDIVIQQVNLRRRKKTTEVDRLLADNTKAKKVIQWQTTHSGIKGLEIGLSKTIDWFRDEKNLNKYKNIYNI